MARKSNLDELKRENLCLHQSVKKLKIELDKLTRTCNASQMLKPKSLFFDFLEERNGKEVNDMSKEQSVEFVIFKTPKKSIPIIQPLRLRCIGGGVIILSSVDPNGNVLPGGNILNITKDGFLELFESCTVPGIKVNLKGQIRILENVS